MSGIAVFIALHTQPVRNAVKNFIAKSIETNINARCQIKKIRGNLLTGVEIDAAHVSAGRLKNRNILRGDFFDVGVNRHDIVVLIHSPTIKNIEKLAKQLHSYAKQYVITDYILAELLSKTSFFEMSEGIAKCGFPLGVLVKN